MTVIVTSPVEGLTPGDEYTGPNEAFLLEYGYARVLNPTELLDLDHPDGADYDFPEEDEVDFTPTPSSQSYGPEPAPETLIQSTVADARVAQVASTRKPLPTPPAPPAPEPEPEPEENPAP